MDLKLGKVFDLANTSILIYDSFGTFHFPGFISDADDLVFFFYFAMNYETTGMKGSFYG